MDQGKMAVHNVVAPAPLPAPASRFKSERCSSLSGCENIWFDLLTRWLPAYDLFILRFQPKNSNFRLPYQRPSSSADCARELFNG